MNTLAVGRTLLIPALLMLTAAMALLTRHTGATVWAIGTVVVSMLAGILAWRAARDDERRASVAPPVGEIPAASPASAALIPPAEAFGPDGDRVREFLVRVASFDTKTWNEVRATARALLMARMRSGAERLDVPTRAFARCVRALPVHEVQELKEANACVSETLDQLRGTVFPPTISDQVVTDIHSIAWALVVRRHLTSAEWETVRMPLVPYCSADELR